MWSPVTKSDLECDGGAAESATGKTGAPIPTKSKESFLFFFFLPGHDPASDDGENGNGLD